RRTEALLVQRCDVLRVNSLASGAVVWRGLRFDNRAAESTVTSDERAAAGLVVHDVIPNSPAGHAALHAGDFIERIGENEVRDVEGFLRAVTEQAGPVTIVIRGRGEIVIGI